jgi:hypothetical protein
MGATKKAIFPALGRLYGIGVYGRQRTMNHHTQSLMGQIESTVARLPAEPVE